MFKTVKYMTSKRCHGWENYNVAGTGLHNFIHDTINCHCTLSDAHKQRQWIGENYDELDHEWF